VPTDKEKIMELRDMQKGKFYNCNDGYGYDKVECIDSNYYHDGYQCGGVLVKLLETGETDFWCDQGIYIEEIPAPSDKVSFSKGKGLTMNAISMNAIAVQKNISDIEAKIETAAKNGNYSVIVDELHQDVVKYFTDAGFVIEDNVISWDQPIEHKNPLDKQKDKIEHKNPLDKQKGKINNPKKDIVRGDYDD
jgi:hypothetical protein